MDQTTSPLEHEPYPSICDLLGEALKHAGRVMGSTMRVAATLYDELPEAVRAAGTAYDPTCVDQLAEWWASLPLDMVSPHTAFTVAIDHALTACVEFEMELFAQEVLGCECPVEVSV